MGENNKELKLTKIAIHGSCCSREIFNSPLNTFNLGVYLFQNPFHTMFEKPFPIKIKEDEVPHNSNFMRRMVASEFNKEALQTLKNNPADYLMIDVGDLRLGRFNVCFDNGEKTKIFKTDDTEKEIQQLKEQLKSFDFTFESNMDICEEEWDSLIHKYVTELKKIYPVNKIILNRIAIATQYEKDGAIIDFTEETGGITFKSKDLLLKLQNKLEEKLKGCLILDNPSFPIIADPNHKLGLHLLHLKQDIYDYKMRRLQDILMEKPKLKVSVIMPCYNTAAFLRQALDSVVNQTLKEIEIICVNDGSTDNTLDIIKEYAAKDKRIVVIDGPNGGYGKAMNKGLDAATGEYIGILEPDDYLELDIYETLHKKAKKTNVDFVKGDIWLWWSEKNERKYSNTINNKNLYDKVQNDLSEMELVVGTIANYAGIYKTQFIRNFNIRYNETQGASFQDQEFYYQVTFNAKSALFINKPVYHYRKDNMNSSINTPSKVVCIFEEYKFIFNKFSELPQKERFLPLIYTKMIDSYLWNLSRSEKSIYPIIKLKVAAEFKKAVNNGLSKKIVGENIWNRVIPFLNIITIPLILSSDNNYAPYMYVTMYSILSNANQNTFYDFYLLVPSAFSKHNTDLILKLKEKYNCDIHFIDMKNAFSDMTMYLQHITSPTYYRLLAIDFLPKEYDKCIYLDVDICVCKDLSELYDIDIGDNYIGACRNFTPLTLVRERLKKLNLDPDKYFNAGVLLINAKKWRDFDLKSKCFHVAETYPKLDYMDQDILNIVCKDSIKWLEHKWNFMWHFLFIQDKMSEQDKLLYTQAQENLAIIHYTSDKKPWKCPHLRYADVWWKYAQCLENNEITSNTNNSNTTIQNKIDYTPKVSVIIPVYNVEEYLRQCLDSVINQTLKEIEIICVDDGSTDNSLKILKEYAATDKRMTVITQENLHAGVARNTGLAVAKGEYVHFLDSDDWVDLDTYEKLYYLIKEKKTNFMKFRSFTYDNKEKKIINHAYTDIAWITEDQVISIDKNLNWAIKMSDAPWSGFYNLAFLNENNIRFNNLKCANDVSFFINCLIKSRAFYFSTKRFVYYRRNNDKSLLGIRPFNFNCQIETYHIINKIAENEPPIIKQALKDRYSASILSWCKQYMEDSRLNINTKSNIYNLTKTFFDQNQDLKCRSDFNFVISPLLFKDIGLGCNTWCEPRNVNDCSYTYDLSDNIYTRYVSWEPIKEGSCDVEIIRLSAVEKRSKKVVEFPINKIISSGKIVGNKVAFRNQKSCWIGCTVEGAYESFTIEAKITNS